MWRRDLHADLDNHVRLFILFSGLDSYKSDGGDRGWRNGRKSRVIASKSGLCLWQTQLTLFVGYAREPLIILTFSKDRTSLLQFPSQTFGLNSFWSCRFANRSEIVTCDLRMLLE
jgi:hypothetical protein